MSLGLLFCAAAPARAATCPAPAGASAALAEVDVEARLRFLRDSLREVARQERRYALGWSLAYVGMAGGTWLLVPFSDDPRKPVESGWSTATALAAAIVTPINSLLVMRDQRRAERLLAQLGPERDRCTTLAAVERLLGRAATSETKAKSPRAHFISLATTVGLGLILGYGLNRPSGAAQNTTIGVIIGELGIATRPTYAIRSLESYRRGELSVTPSSDFSLALLPSVSERGYSVSLTGTF